MKDFTWSKEKFKTHFSKEGENSWQEIYPEKKNLTLQCHSGCLPLLPEKGEDFRAFKEIPCASEEDGNEMQTDYSQLGMSGGWEVMTKNSKGRFWHKDKIMTIIKH